jgi:uncharacterized protein (DUF58 family)
MRTISRHNDAALDIDRQTLQALGVLIPLRLSPLKFLPGRHPLGRAGGGLRFLRTRPFQAGEDNPRDIDKFSPPDDRQVIEWEEEVQASITLLADVSASMALPLKAALRNASLLQLTYSLWRAGDRVGTVFFSSTLHQEIRQANLKMQMERLSEALTGMVTPASTDIVSVLRTYLNQARRRHPDLLFLVSDFVSLTENDFELDTQWRPILNQLRHNLIPVIITFEIPAGIRGMMKLWDPERRTRSLTWFSPDRVGEVNREERERVASLTQHFRAAGLDYLVVSGQRQIYPQLAQLARQRRRRKN